MVEERQQTQPVFFHTLRSLKKAKRNQLAFAIHLWHWDYERTMA